MMKRYVVLTLIAMVMAAVNCFGQTIKDSSYRTIAHIKSDGTIQDASYRTIGHFKSDGTIQDASYRTIGHSSGVSREWVAIYFFFR